MNGKLIGWIGTMFMATLLWVPATVYGWGGTLTIKYNSIHCFDLVTGGTNQKSNDGAASCAILIKEIGTVCRNKAGNAQSSSSHNFTLRPTPIQEAQGSKDFIIQKNGKTLSDIEFTRAEIQAALGDQLPDLDPAVLCPNKNWQVLDWAVTRFDMVATVNNVLADYVPFFPSLGPNAAFSSCDPATSGLTYTNDGGTTTLDTAGILSECWLFRNQFTNVDSFFTGDDKGGVALLNFTPGAFYNGVCQEHGRQSGSLNNIGGYTVIGPSASDAECTGLNTVLDGTY